MWLRQVKCVGDEELQKGVEEIGLPGNVRLHSLTVGLDHACVVAFSGGEGSGKALCWGSNWLNADMNEDFLRDMASDAQLVFVGKSVASEGPLHSISAGTEHTCGVTQGGELQCWGMDSHVRDTGVPTGNHWLAVKAAHMRTCAVSLVGGGVLACWGATGRAYLESINLQAFRLCPAASSAADVPHARVRHYGPDLSSLDHYDGTWLHVLPAELLLERDPFITILSPEVSRLAFLWVYDCVVYFMLLQVAMQAPGILLPRVRTFSEAGPAACAGASCCRRTGCEPACCSTWSASMA